MAGKYSRPTVSLAGRAILTDHSRFRFRNERGGEEREYEQPGHLRDLW